MLVTTHASHYWDRPKDIQRLNLLLRDWLRPPARYSTCTTCLLNRWALARSSFFSKILKGSYIHQVWGVSTALSQDILQILDIFGPWNPLETNDKMLRLQLGMLMVKREAKPSCFPVIFCACPACPACPVSLDLFQLEDAANWSVAAC